MIDLKDKNILLFIPSGNPRQHDIYKELIRRGANVSAYNERPYTSTIGKIMIRLLKKKVPSFYCRYIKTIIKQNPTRYDYILVVRGEAFTKQAIKLLNNAYPDATTILYLWDILKTNNLTKVIPFFDRALTFDPEDAKTLNKLEFRPTFFSDAFIKIAQKTVLTSCDISFVGTIHSNRHITINKMHKLCKQQGLIFKSYCYIPSKLLYLRDRIFKYPFIAYNKVKFKPASKQEIINYSLQSKSILDINYTGQKSLSMRAFEAMAIRKKYITTNPEITKYDFYLPENILVIDPIDPVIPLSFLESDFVQISDEIMDHYSVKSLIDCLFDKSIKIEYLSK